MLALLLAARGRSVSTAALIDGVWGADPPATARKTLQGYVHHLRREVGSVLVTDGAGYSLSVDDASVDDRRFAFQLEAARPLTEVDPIAASDMFADALALWRGNPYADLEGEPSLRAEITRLEELRIMALGDRIEADLGAGRHESLIGELEGLCAEFPLHERFRGQHMLALYRSGRHGEALRSYSTARQIFVEELGIEPSIELVELERAILNRSPWLAPKRSDASAGAKAVRGYELREVTVQIAHETVYRAYQRSVGREVEVRVMHGPEVDDPYFISRLDAWVASRASLDHKNIAHLYDAWREPGRFYQVIQSFDGQTLSEVLASQHLSSSSALDLLSPVGAALSYAHQHGVTHGHVGGDVVRVSSTGDVLVTGFAVDGADPVDDRLAFGRLARTMFEWVEGIDAVLDAATSGDGAPIEDTLHGLRQVLGVEGAEPAHPGATVLTDRRNPFKGLRAFQTADEDDFFGRDELVDRMERVLATHRLVAVVGPSGAGKSSAVKAGLAARLERRSEPTLVAEMFPGRHPFEELAVALRRVAVGVVPTTEILTSDDRGLASTLKAALPPGEAELILVVDQFEELFTLVSDDERALFIDGLVDAVTDPRARLRLVLTMRADFFDHPLRYPEFGELFETGLVPVTMLDPDGLAVAIEGPARRVGVSIEPGLTERIIHDVEREPGGLPLLQYTLTELFRRRTTDTLTIVGYQAIGGVLGALASTAEELYQSLDSSEQEAIRQTLLRLVAVREGGDNLRRRATRRELVGLGLDRRALDSTLQMFGAHRLLTFDADPVSRAPTIEVAHEALLSQWDRLRGWIADQRDDLVLRRRLEVAITEWELAEEDAGFLLTGPRLAYFDAWASSTDLPLTGRERSFLEASRRRDQAAVDRAIKRRRRVLVALTSAAVVATVLALAAFSAQRRADEQRSIAEQQTAIAEQEATRTVGASQELLAYAQVAAAIQRPDVTDAVIADALPADEALVRPVPTTPRLDFLNEDFCFEDRCILDARMVNLDQTLSAGEWLADEPFHIRQGFANVGAEPLLDALEGRAYDLLLYLVREEGPVLSDGAFPIGGVQLYRPDYLVRTTTDRCGPDYRDLEAAVPCDQFVHEFPDGLPPGRYTFYVEWHAPCGEWVVPEACSDPDRSVTLLNSITNMPLFSADFTRVGEDGRPAWPFDPWADAEPIGS